MPRPPRDAALPRAAAVLGILAVLVAALALGEAGRGHRFSGRRAPAPIEVAADLRYGPAPLQRLDVYRGPAMRDAPVVVFVHGGAYRFGDKNEAHGRYTGLARFFVGHGVVFVNADYRLAPVATWPSGTRDVAAITAWVRAAIGRYGGDPDRIALLGHSAGATHVAGYVFDRRFEPAGGAGVRAAILISGRYALTGLDSDPAIRLARDYFGADPAGWADRAPAGRVGSAPPLPVLVVTAGRENRDLTRAAVVLAGRIRAAGRAATLATMVADDETHTSEMAAITRPGSPLGAEILRFLHGAGVG